MFRFSLPQLITRPTVLLTIAAVSLAILIILRPGKPAPALVSRWQPPAVVTQPDVHTGREGEAAPAPLTGQAVAIVSDALDLQVDDGLFADQREALAAEMQDALSYVSERFGTQPSARFTAAVQVDAACGLHGIAYTDARNVHVYTCPGIERQRVVNIMAHEMVHQLSQDRYGAAHLNSDLILLEGVATWGAGKYWLAGQPDFRTVVHEQRKSGVSYPLATDYNGLGIAGMNALYYQWASFVEYLIKVYGREQFDQLYVSGNSAPGSADYQGVYGKSLDVLEREWAAWVDQ